ncbi:hypothetical protein GGI24_003478, partial [Coemansia furcata]
AFEDLALQTSESEADEVEDSEVEADVIDDLPVPIDQHELEDAPDSLSEIVIPGTTHVAAKSGTGARDTRKKPLIEILD